MNEAYQLYKWIWLDLTQDALVRMYLSYQN